MEPDVKNCILCGGKIVKSALPFCSLCQRKDAENLLLAQAYIKDNSATSLLNIAEKTGIPYKVIQWHFEHGNLRYNQKHHQLEVKNDKGLSITDTMYGNYIWLEVRGKIDSTNALTLQRYIDRLIENEWLNFIIDMNYVTFFSSTGIRVFMSLYKTLDVAEGSIKIINPSSNVKNVLGMVALDTLLLRQ